MGAIDYWCNTFTAEGLERHWRQQPEIMEVVSWWGMEPRLVARTVPEFLAFMDEGDVDAVMIPSAKMASYTTQRLIWDVSEDEVTAIARQAPGRIYGLFGILLAVMWLPADVGWASALLLLLPLFVARWAYAQYAEEQRAYDRTVSTLMAAVETMAQVLPPEIADWWRTA